MKDVSFNDRIYKLYSRSMMINVFVINGFLIGIVALFAIGFWQAVPLGILIAVYVLTQVLPTKPIKYFMFNYMDVGEPDDIDAEFLNKTLTKGDIFGLQSPWKEYEAVFV